MSKTCSALRSYKELMRSMAAGASSAVGTSGPPIPEYQRQFIESLEVFMEQCYVIVETRKQALNAGKDNMSEKERLARFKSVNSLIENKTKELSKLRAEKEELLKSLGKGSQTEKMQQSAPSSVQSSRGAGFQCFDDCESDCKLNTSSSIQQPASQPRRTQ